MNIGIFVLQLEPLLRKLTKGPVLHTIATLSRRVSNRATDHHATQRKNRRAKTYSVDRFEHIPADAMSLFIVLVCTTSHTDIATIMRTSCMLVYTYISIYIYIYTCESRKRFLSYRMSAGKYHFVSLLSRKLLANVSVVNVTAAQQPRIILSP